MGGQGVGLGVNDIPIVGEPVAFGAGFIALLFVCFSTYFGRTFYAYAAVGGQLLALVGLAQRTNGFAIAEKGPFTATAVAVGRGWIIAVIVLVAGYIAPSLLGLAGAALIAAGNPWAVLLAATIFSLLALIAARGSLAFTIPLLVVLGLGAVLLYGSGTQQAFVATFVVWFLLIAATLWAFRTPAGGDPNSLAGKTLIPGVLWQLLFIGVAIVSLIVGGQLLLRPGYGIG